MSKILDFWQGMTGTVLPFAGVNAPAGWMLCDGTAVSRTTYAALFAAITLTSSGTRTSGNNTITGVPNAITSAVEVGMPLSGDGIPAGATVSSKTATTIVMSANATASSSANFVIAPFGVGDGSTTFNLPDLRGEFIRGADRGRGVDSGRAQGSAQLPTNIFGHVGEIGPGQLEIGGENMDTYTGYSYAGRVVTANGSALTHYKFSTRPRNVALNHIIRA